MDVKYLGFDISVEHESAGVSPKEFFEHLEQENILIMQKDVDGNESEHRQIFVNTTHDEDYYLGLIVTFKEQRKLPRAEKTLTGLTFKVSSLEDPTQRFMDFNFFIVNKENGLGLYQHYHQSCSLNIAGILLKKSFRELSNSKIEAAIDLEKITLRAEQKKLTNRQEVKLRKSMKSSIVFTPLVTVDELEDVLKSYKKLKSIEFEYSFLDARNTKGLALSRYVSKRKEKLTFNSTFSINSLARDIKAFTERSDVNSGRVIAEDYDGTSVPVKLFNAGSCFKVEDFDDLAQKLHGVEVSKFHSCDVIASMLSVCKAEKTIFDVEVTE
ncbi:hypothetical protein BCU30_021790 [Vibrio lentus]|uniref:hypothetical protein n=1 Tax=Vibrio TaxID=662 RepID=UPI000C850668|nr:MULTISPECIES: hypothetical protein [Vibrio]MBU2907871.1 hypothetical protein [Vibrio splendidus]MDO6530188.1 hypothetical protein [Vibrio splendidus]MDO6551243.1 hypothetical protein [Vibrio splendidus]PMJ11354.1 hypothetical protein BCU30_06720 [Vibrio lentus]